MKNTIKGIMLDIGFYQIHRNEIKYINNMNIPQLIRYCCFCFGMAVIGIVFLI